MSFCTRQTWSWLGFGECIYANLKVCVTLCAKHWPVLLRLFLRKPIPRLIVRTSLCLLASWGISSAAEDAGVRVTAGCLTWIFICTESVSARKGKQGCLIGNAGWTKVSKGEAKLGSRWALVVSNSGQRQSQPGACIKGLVSLMA